MTRRPVRWLSLVAGAALLAASPALAQVATLQAWQNPTTLTSTPGDNAGTVQLRGPDRAGRDEPRCCCSPS